MTVSRLMMPAVTLAGALALAGCGGGGGAGLSPAEIAANEAADAAATATNGAVDAAFALDLTADDAGDKVSAAAGLITAARTAVGRLTEGQSGQADGLTARLSQANQFVTLAGELLAQKAKAAMEAKEAADDLKMAMDNAEQAARDAKEAAETAAARAAMAQETAVTEAEAEVRREAAAEAERVKQAADALLEAEKAKVTAAQNELDTANSRITALQGEIRTLEGRIRTAENEKTEAENAERTAEATKAAQALHARLVTATSVSGGVPANSSVAPGVKAEHKGIETLRDDDGQPWAYAAGVGPDDADLGETRSLAAFVGAALTAGTNAGYFPILGTAAHEVKADAFTPRNNLRHKKDASFTGSYKGVQGTFKCTGTAGCTSSPDNAENTMFILNTSAVDATNSWHFRPNDAQTKLQGSKVAEWGWWMADSTATPSVAGAGAVKLRYEVLNPTTGEPDDKQQSFPTAGEATYTGKAHGQYAIVDGADSESGAFEATASLTARFRSANTELSGRVHDFDVNSGWEVMLKEDKVHTDGVFAGKTVWKTDGEDGLGEGDWNATMHGTAREEPTHVVGGFTATDAGARMVGAFGAEPPKQE